MKYFNVEKLRNYKIRVRILVAFFITISVPMLFIAVGSYIYSSSSIKSKVSSYSSQQIIQVSQSIENWILKYEGYIKKTSFADDFQQMLNDYDTSAPDVQAQYKQKINDTYVKSIKGNAGVSSAVVITNGGASIADDPDSNKLQTITSDKSNLSGAIYCNLLPNSGNASKDKYSINFFRDLKAITLGTVIGQMYIDVNENELYNVYGGGNNNEASLFIVNSKGIVISSKDKSQISKKYKYTDLMSNIKSEEKSKDSDKTFSMKIGGKKSIVTYSPIDNSDWYVISVTPYSYINSEAIVMRNNIILISLITLILIFAISYVLTGAVSNPLENLIAIMNDAKNGKLSSNLVDNSKDETGEVIRSFNGMLSKIRSLIIETRKISDDFVKSTEAIAAIAENTYSSSESIANTTEEIAKGATEQARAMTEGNTSLEELSSQFDVMEGSMKETLEVVTYTKNLGEGAISAVDELVDKSKDTLKASENMTVQTNELFELMKQIEGTTKLIVELSEHTNLLSLNASIEAARAGEAGAGFNVVADEVRNLADQSKEASIKIGNIINSLKEKTNFTMKKALETQNTIENQADTITQTSEAITTVINSMGDVNSKINEMIASVKDIHTLRENTVEAIEGISSVAEQAAAVTEEVNATTSEQITGMETLSKFADSFKEMAKELNKALDVFVVK